jgi:hypothetical protein
MSNISRDRERQRESKNYLGINLTKHVQDQCKKNYKSQAGGVAQAVGAPA